MPTKPKSPPKKRIENSTQKLESPVELPRIFGPRILPSNCCRSRIQMRKYTHWSGLTKNTRNAAGIAPMNGPKKGITFVTPIMTLKSIGKINAYLAHKRFGINSQPYYLILGPDERPLVPGRGYNLDVQAFVDFLEEGLLNYRALK